VRPWTEYRPWKGIVVWAACTALGLWVFGLSQGAAMFSFVGFTASIAWANNE
jgi:hypothetical protein